MASPCIASDSDIAGIGVRVSIYIHAFLHIVCTAVYATNGDIGYEEERVLAEASKNLALTTFALLLTATIQAAMKGISIYHALIVLNLCWINAFSATIHSVVTVNSALAEAERFRNLVLVTCLDLLAKPSAWREGKDAVLTAISEWARDHLQLTTSSTVTDYLHLILSQFWGIRLDEGYQVLAVATYTGMGMFGLVVWSDVSRFGNDEQRMCTAQTFLPILGTNVPVLAEHLRTTSLMAYAISFTTLPLITLFGALSLIVGRVILFRSSFILAWTLRYFFNLRLADAYLRLEPSARFKQYLSGIVCMTLLEVLFIVDTELMISRSLRAGVVEQGEDIWSFGQTLAMVLVFLPIFQILRAIWTSRKMQGAPPRVNIDNTQAAASGHEGHELHDIEACSGIRKLPSARLKRRDIHSTM